MKLTRLITRVREDCARLTQPPIVRCLVVSALLVSALLGSAVWVSWDDWWENGSVAGAFFNRKFVGRMRPWWAKEEEMREHIQKKAYFLDGRVLISPEDDEEIDNRDISPRPIAYVNLFESTSSRGLWAPTEEQLFRRVSIGYLTTFGNERELRRAFAATEARFADVSETDASYKRILWGGVLVNTATAILGIGSVLSLVWVQRYLASHICNRRALGERCTRCGYDLSGLDKDTICPECGTPTGRDT